MNLQGMKIGYVPYTNTLTAPGDRRRFCYYAKKRNINYEIAKPGVTYDVLVLSTFSDISFWVRHHNNAKIIYDLIDSYLAPTSFDAKSSLRGLAKFVSRQSKYLEINYRDAIRRMCQRADAVICTTMDQRKDILPYCNNVHIILDVHTNAITSVKTDYASGSTFNLVWEGLGCSVQTLAEISPVLKRLQKRHAIALHLVTDLEYPQYLAKYVVRDTKSIARKLFDNVYLYQWNEHMFSAIVAACDMAVIPNPLNNPVYSGKPENKLVLFWRMGIPVLVSATPAYERTMRACNLDMACGTLSEWEEKLEYYIQNESARREAGIRGKEHAEQYYGEEKLLSLWDDVFRSVSAAG